LFNEYLAVCFAGLSHCSYFLSFFNIRFNLSFLLTVSVQFKVPSRRFPGETERLCVLFSTLLISGLYCVEW
jgi:hypothetical protein